MAEDSPVPGADPPSAAGAFDIAVAFVGDWSGREQLQPAFLRAAERLEAAVVGDLPDAIAPGPGGAPVPVDDLLVLVELPDLDGVGGAFGSSNPTLLRTEGLLPVAAEMRFDAADAAALEEGGRWGAVVLHEMLHALGFGTLWPAKGLLAPSPPDGLGYVGPAGVAEYAAAGGAGPVPVETGGGDGTAGLHWSEAVFGDELMTGWIGDPAPLGPVTIASLADLGYALAPREAWPVDAAYA